MFRLGIVGSDNSHAERFSALANGLDPKHRVPDVQVTYIYGTDPERTKEVATKSKIPHIAVNMEDMIGEVDGILCVWRHGSKHLADTLPFLKAGIPAFVDKPLATTVDDARTLIETAQAAGVGLTSFSTLRFDQGVLAFKNELPKTIGSLAMGISTGPADRASEYDGIFFYGIHAVELMNAIWGYGCSSVTAAEHNGNVVATCKFSNGTLVTLNLLGKSVSGVFQLAAYGDKGHAAYTIDSGGSYYYDGMLQFMETLRNGKWLFTPDELLEPIKILTALERSLTEHREVSV